MAPYAAAGPGEAPPPGTPPPVSAARWAVRAILTGVTLLACGGALGAVLSFVYLPVGIALGAGIMFLGGSVWAGKRIGPVAGFFAATLLGTAGAVGAGIESRKAWVATQGTIERRTSVADWNADDGAWLLQTSPVSYLPDAFATVRVREARSYSTLGVARHTFVGATAIPLVDDATGRVLAFDCLDPDDPDEYRGEGGGYLLSLEPWKLVDEVACGAAVATAAAAATEGGHPVAPGAERRFVRAFASEASLRSEHNMDEMAALGLKMLGLYSFCVTLFCRSGAASLVDGAPRGGSAPGRRRT